MITFKEMLQYLNIDQYFRIFNYNKDVDSVFKLIIKHCNESHFELINPYILRIPLKHSTDPKVQHLDIWIFNYPYAGYRLWSYNALPSRLTNIRFHLKFGKLINNMKKELIERENKKSNEELKRVAKSVNDN
jgi:hypothetical protein